jgi:hypothetical protein
MSVIVCYYQQDCAFGTISIEFISTDNSSSIYFVLIATFSKDSKPLLGSHTIHLRLSFACPRFYKHTISTQYDIKYKSCRLANPRAATQIIYAEYIKIIIPAPPTLPFFLQTLRNAWRKREIIIGAVNSIESSMWFSQVSPSSTSGERE